MKYLLLVKDFKSYFPSKSLNKYYFGYFYVFLIIKFLNIRLKYYRKYNFFIRKKSKFIPF